MVALGVPVVASLAQAEQAADRYPLFQGHPFPTCFTCGPDRAAGDWVAWPRGCWRDPRACTPYCLAAWRDGPPDGRKRQARSALLDGQGRVLAVARAVWVTIR